MDYYERKEFYDAAEKKENLLTSELDKKWIKDNLPSKDSSFINFTYNFASDKERNEFENILLYPSEKNENKSKHSKMIITENEDSVTISFWQNKVLYGCFMAGNIELRNDTIVLLTEKICSPYAQLTDGEIFLMHLKYVIKPKAYRKVIITETRHIN